MGEIPSSPIPPYQPDLSPGRRDNDDKPPLSQGLRLPADNPLGDIASSRRTQVPRPLRVIASGASWWSRNTLAGQAIRGFATLCVTLVRAAGRRLRPRTPRVPLSEPGSISPEQAQGFAIDMERVGGLKTGIRAQVHGLGIKEADSREDKIAFRTRYDYLRYARQITEAGQDGLDQTYLSLYLLMSSFPEATMYGGYEAYRTAGEELNEHIRMLPRSEAYSGLSAQQLQELDSDNPEVRGAAVNALREAYRQPAHEMTQSQRNHAESLSKQTQTISSNVSERLVNYFRREIRDNTDLPAARKRGLEEQLDAITREIPKHIGRSRKAQIHARKEWTQRKEFLVPIQGPNHTSIEVVSALEAVGKPVSSMEARKGSGLPMFINSQIIIPEQGSALQQAQPIDVDDSQIIVPEEGFSLQQAQPMDVDDSQIIVPSQGSALQQAQPIDVDDDEDTEEPIIAVVATRKRVVEWTTSSTPVEFGLPDTSRPGATRDNVQEILDYKEQRALSQVDITLLPTERLSTDEADVPVLAVRYQHVMLLTPDLSRAAVAAVAPGMIHMADRERQLVEECYAANRSFNGASRDRLVDVDGQQVKVRVRFEVDSWNIPCNVLQERLTDNVASAWLASHDSTDQMNIASMTRMTAQISAKFQGIDEDLGSLYREMEPSELTIVNAMLSSVRAKQSARMAISEIMRRGDRPTSDQIRDYTEKADAVVSLMKAMKEGASDRLVGYLELLEERYAIEDLYADLDELVATKAYMNPKALDGNRYAMVSRILLLGHHLNRESHMGCRSGKDRTYIADADAKQLFAEAVLLGRYPTYFEAERSPEHRENTGAMLLEGGAEFRALAATGATGSLTMKGAKRSPWEEEPDSPVTRVINDLRSILEPLPEAEVTVYDRLIGVHVEKRPE